MTKVLMTIEERVAEINAHNRTNFTAKMLSENTMETRSVRKCFSDTGIEEIIFNYYFSNMWIEVVEIFYSEYAGYRLSWGAGGGKDEISPTQYADNMIEIMQAVKIRLVELTHNEESKELK